MIRNEILIVGGSGSVELDSERCSLERVETFIYIENGQFKN